MKRTLKCLYCGKEFTTASAVQKYCSVECADAAKEAKKKKRENLLRAVEPIADLSQVEYFTISKAATLMGCSRQYVYKLVQQGRLPASRLSNRMSYVRRADIEALLAGNPYRRIIPCQQRTSVAKPKAMTDGKGKQTEGRQVEDQMEFYSGEDVMRNYKINKSWLYTCSKRYGIVTCRIAGHVYYSKRDIDEYFGIANDYSGIEEWVTINEVKELYDVKPSGISSTVHRHKIPTKREYGVTYYSKKHLDELFRPDILADENYCTSAEAALIMGVTTANLHHIVSRFNITKVKVGSKNMLLKSDVERALKARKEQGL